MVKTDEITSDILGHDILILTLYYLIINKLITVFVNYYFLSL